MQRTWSTYHIAALWIGMSVVITTYTLASGLMQQGMSWWQAMLTILLGNSIVHVPMILNAHAGTKYGVSFPVLCRAAFGVKGANVPAVLRALVACGWFGIQTWIGGLALNTLIVAAWPPWATIGAGVWISFAAFWLVQVWIKGVNRRAMVVLVLSILPVVPGFIRAAVTPGGQIANPTIWDHLSTYAWFVTFGLSFGMYLIVSRSPAKRFRSGK